MLIQDPIKLPSSRSMRSGAQFLGGFLGFALIMLFFIVGLEFPVATARSEVGPSPQIVNRTHKGDRLPKAASDLNKLNEFRAITISLSADSNLAAGCEPLVSPLVHSPLARIAGRCVS